MRKIFILGLGCQKSGTSWLYNYLSKSKNFQKGFTKEYHIWDCIDIGHQKKELKKKFFKEFKSNFIIGSKLFLMRNYNNYYFNYFNSLYSKDTQITADITPVYNGLSAERLLMIDNKFKELSIEVKPIIIFRDPVDRIKSDVNMTLRKLNININEQIFKETLERSYNSTYTKIRSRYANILKATKKVFKDRFKVMFFENMFTEKGAREISDYCETDYFPEMIKKVINPYRNNKSFYTDSLDKKIRNYYFNEYQYINKNYPETLKLWKS